MKEEQKAIFSLRLGALRTGKKLSQEELAAAVSIDRGTIAKYETKKRIPSFEHLTSLAQFFNTTIDYLLGLSETQVKDASLTAAQDYTGLEEEALKTISSLPTTKKEIVSYIIQSDEFSWILTFFEDSKTNHKYLYPSVENAAMGVIAKVGLSTPKRSFDNIPPEFADALSIVGTMGLEPMYKQKICENIIRLFEKHLKEGETEWQT